MRMKLLSPVLKIYALAAMLLCLSVKSAETIQPGAPWPDHRGQHIQAHGGGMLKVDDTFYWFGEDRSRGNSFQRRYVSCYASTIWRSERSATRS
jgi:hypothetical protein